MWASIWAEISYLISELCYFTIMLMWWLSLIVLLGFLVLGCYKNPPLWCVLYRLEFYKK